MCRSPSSNRTCRFPASGSPTRVIERPAQGVDGVPSQSGKPIAVQTRVETLALSKRTAAPLAPIPQKTPESHPHVVVDGAEDPSRIAVAEVRSPSAQQRVDGCHRVEQRAFRARARQRTELL